MKTIKRIFKFFTISLICFCAIVLFINAWVCFSTLPQITENPDIEADCILVLGAGIKNNKPSLMLHDRLETAISLYQQGKAKKIVMSGDHGDKYYNKVGVMKNYAIEKGIPSNDIFMDHAGFSTYESLYRIQNIFQAKKIIIVTQDYHLYRALYIANSLGIEAKGVSATTMNYKGQITRDIREIAARCKDFFTCIKKPLPTYLGDKISLDGNGDSTNDSPF